MLFMQVTRISSVTKEGIPELWEKMQEFRKTMVETGLLETKRERQHKVATEMLLLVILC